jgi:O-antigen/teichoic acid export membrane protein
LDVFRIYILVDMVRFASMTLILSAAGKTRLLMILGFVTLAINGGLNLALYHLWGMNGPAVATLAAGLVMGFVLLCLSARELEGTLRDLFDGKYLLSVGLGSMLGVVLFSMLGRWLEAKGMWYFLILLIVCGGYCLVFLLLNGKRLFRDLKFLNRAPGGR